MKKQLKWAIMPVVAIAMTISLSAFTSASEAGKEREYQGDCPPPSTKTITVCGVGSSTCTASGECP